MEARIPFSGFYESMWSKAIDDEEEQWAERLAEEHQIKQDDIQELLFRHTTYQVAYRHVAAEYVKSFEEFINRELGLKLSLAFNDMTSPKYYNFETDALYVGLSPRDVVLLARRVGLPAIRKAAKEMFTSRDGFMSFYSPRIDEWGKLRTWDHNQLYALMTAAVTVADGDSDEYGMDWGIYEDMSSNGDFSTAHDKAIDYPTIVFEIGKLVAAKELKEELEEQDDGRRFPVAWSDTADYVRRYSQMNASVTGGAYAAFNTNSNSKEL